MPMFVINLYGKESIYEQIRKQILKFIQAGVLKPNDKLPSVRELSMDLGINPNTVQKAYQRLEEDGYIYILSKKGAYVAASEGIDIEKITADLKLQLEAYRDEGIKREELIALIDAVYGKDDYAKDRKCK